MPLLGNIIGSVDVGLTLGTSGSSGTSTSGTSGTSTTATTPSTAPNAPSTPSPVPTGASILAWAIQTGETLYLNMAPSQGPTAWVPFVVRYVFADGNAVLTRDPDVVAYTGGFVVGANLRRKSEIYTSSYPGP